jgi:hypothetical protein
MIPSVNGFTGASEPAGPVQRLDRDAAARVLATLSTKETADDQLAALLERSFHAALLDALSQIPEKRGQSQGPLAQSPPASKAPTVPVQLPTDPGDARGLQDQPGAASQAAIVPSSTTEDVRIRDAASRAAVDPRFLGALRRAENGGPGREFGVLSVSAPTYDDQVRLAAASIRRNVERFEATGRAAIDPATGRYTEEFIRFFSNRYAPVGASNDPSGLNQHHARNLIRLYARAASTDG